ncbi:PREDICTED: diacylglycerol kinase 3-like isoform X2 [Populus euphratica]|uniref:diacylglycerol kinase (ATP) n=1 Tax=Populus euphratica TaxID=75702 RepID=A0AAJ6XGH9_POPEU|nr:PREDICTED: diacylglycerol kinase 3-like isoform X2 [Populus euphratica]
MDSPTASTTEGSTARIVTSRSSVIESIRGCGLSGLRVNKEDLKKKLSMPKYLRHAIRDSINSKDVNATADRYREGNSAGREEAPEGPMVVFVNSRSGGRHGPELKERLQQLMGEEQVFDLSEVRPNEFVAYGLGCLEKLAGLGDFCAKDTRDKLRILVAGGDGTVGWVLGSLTELHRQGREPVPPVAVIPLGTGNDLSRSFGWGGSFPFAWKSAVKRSLLRAITGPVCRLDSWHLLMAMPRGEVVDPPHSLKSTDDCSLDQGLRIEGELPEKMNCYEGVFYNYFSIGMDAQVAYGFHHLRNEKPYLAQGPISNKLIYSGYTCTQGWFLTPCISDPSLRGLKNIIRMHVKKVNCSEWEQIPVPKSVRAIVALNLHSYASGRNPWGSPKPEYLEKFKL